MRWMRGDVIAYRHCWRGARVSCKSQNKNMLFQWKSERPCERKPLRGHGGTSSNMTAEARAESLRSASVTETQLAQGLQHSSPTPRKSSSSGALDWDPAQ